MASFALKLTHWPMDKFLRRVSRGFFLVAVNAHLRSESWRGGPGGRRSSARNESGPGGEEDERDSVRSDKEMFYSFRFHEFLPSHVSDRLSSEIFPRTRRRLV